MSLIKCGSSASLLHSSNEISEQCFKNLSNKIIINIYSFFNLIYDRFIWINSFKWLINELMTWASLFTTSSNYTALETKKALSCVWSVLKVVFEKFSLHISVVIRRKQQQQTVNSGWRSPTFVCWQVVRMLCCCHGAWFCREDRDVLFSGWVRHLCGRLI